MMLRKLASALPAMRIRRASKEGVKLTIRAGADWAKLKWVGDPTVSQLPFALLAHLGVVVTGT